MLKLRLGPLGPLQFSTLVELEPGNVRVSVCPSALFPGNRAKDFAETWHDVKEQ